VIKPLKKKLLKKKSSSKKKRSKKRKIEEIKSDQIVFQKDELLNLDSKKFDDHIKKLEMNGKLNDEEKKSLKKSKED